MNVTYTNGPIFDGSDLHHGKALRVQDGKVAEILSTEQADGKIVDLKGDILSPGYVDLQVNGGGGVQFNDSPTLESLSRISDAHRQLGATHILPTLITDSPDVTAKAISATVEACRAGIPGIAGLHLEGPHLSLSRKGAHDPSFIRAMTDDDLGILLRAAQNLPALMVTLAPENATLDQVQALSQAGVTVSLGHSDCAHGTAKLYQQAGARAVTHLFNAMSQLGNREPGLVGATLSNGGLSAGLIADGIHVHADTVRAAWAAKTAPGRIFLVSDSMAVAGTDVNEFNLNGRVIRRSDARLTLSDGTLAGADLDLTTAIRVMVTEVGIDLKEALAAATSVPASVARLGNATGLIQIGCNADLIRINADLSGCIPI